MLEVKNIDVSYGDLQVLWDVSFEVNEGEIVALVGANGAGKSTTLKTVSGLLRPNNGSVRFLDQRLDQIPAHKIIEHGIAQVPEGRRLFPEMSVRENLIMGSLSPQAKAKRGETMEWIFGLFPRLREREKQLAGTLSGGEQQMCAVGRGLMALPRLIMFDEPSLGLAPILVADIFRIIERIQQEGVTVLIVEQNTKHTLEICTRGYV
ncbi:MAG: transporter ATP-binding protein, partial [Deltaproteobacteria bacterium]|nr:transporter ATP-binding protein [Deltaproteobacteria bacterium]